MHTFSYSIRMDLTFPFAGSTIEHNPRAAIIGPDIPAVAAGIETGFLGVRRPTRHHRHPRRKRGPRAALADGRFEHVVVVDSDGGGGGCGRDGGNDDDVR